MFPFYLRFTVVGGFEENVARSWQNLKGVSALRQIASPTYLLPFSATLELGELGEWSPSLSVKLALDSRGTLPLKSVRRGASSIISATTLRPSTRHRAPPCDRLASCCYACCGTERRGTSWESAAASARRSSLARPQPFSSSRTSVELRLG